MTQQLRSQWHWFDNFIISLRILWLILSIVQYSSLTIDSPLHWLTLLWVVASFLLPLYYFRPNHLNIKGYYWTELLVTGPLYIFLILHGQWQALAFLGLQVIIFGYLGTPTLRSKLLIGALFIAIIPLSNLLGHFGLPVWEIVKKFFDFVLFYGLGACFHYVVKQNQLIKEKNQALEQHTKVIERLTLIEERNRLARDMHDTIGHTFITTITGLNAVKCLLKQDPVEAEKSVDELLAVTHEGLQEIRQSIHQISDDNNISSKLSDRLASLAEQFGKFTKTEIVFHHTGMEHLYPEVINSTLSRFLQESLTNAKRHGLAPRINIQLVLHDKEIELTVEDFGQGAKKLKEGFGIRAMRERICAAWLFANQFASEQRHNRPV